MENYNNCQGKSVKSNIAPGDSEASVYGVDNRLIETPPRLHGPEGLVDRFIRIIHTEIRSS